MLLPATNDTLAEPGAGTALTPVGGLGAFGPAVRMFAANSEVLPWGVLDVAVTTAGQPAAGGANVATPSVPASAVAMKPTPGPKFPGAAVVENNSTVHPEQVAADTF